MHITKRILVGAFVAGAACTSSTGNDPTPAPNPERGDAPGGVQNQDASNMQSLDAKENSVNPISGAIYGQLVLAVLDRSLVFAGANFAHQSLDDVPKGCTESRQADCRVRTCQDNSLEPPNKMSWPHGGRIEVSTQEVTLPALLPGGNGKYETVTSSDFFGIQSLRPARFSVQGNGAIPAFSEMLNIPPRIVLDLPKVSGNGQLVVSTQRDLAFGWSASTPSRDFYLRIWKGQSFLQCIVPVEKGRLNIPGATLVPFTGGGISLATSSSLQSTHGKLQLSVHVLSEVYGPDLRPLRVMLE